MTTAALTHIELDDQGRPWLAGTRVKVIEVALGHIANGFSPAEIHFQHPHLSLGQIHAALAYYFDHRVELDAEIARQLAEYEQLHAANRDSPGRQKLRMLRMIP
jgi:uncharacterized protein (DUF433 family)